MQIPLRLLSATQRRKRLYPVIAKVFREHGLLPSWGLAFAYCESNFRPWVVTESGGDGRRGGAWGLFQMTFRTAQGLGFVGVANKLLDAEFNTQIAAKYIAQHKANYGDLLNVAARYNSGRPFYLAPGSAQKYANKVAAQQKFYSAMGADQEA